MDIDSKAFYMIYSSSKYAKGSEKMRLDKFLKVSRVIKRRTVANEAADGGRVSVNGKIVKPSYDVKVGDIVEIKFGDKISKFEIINIPQVQGKDMGELIKIL